MHPSISTFLRLGCGGNWSMWNILLLLLGDSKARMVIQFHKLSVMGLSYCLLSVGHAQETSKARLSRVIPIRCHLSLLLSMQRSNDSTQSSAWIYELLTLSLRLSPATLQRKLISATFIFSHILLVTIQIQRPQVRVGTQMDQ